MVKPDRSGVEMPALADVRTLVERMVHGVVRADGSIDAHLMQHCTHGYTRAFFFTDHFADLHGHADRLQQAVQAHSLVPSADIPAREVTAQAVAGVEPCSLNSLMKIRGAVEAVRDRGRDIQSIAGFSESLARYFPHPNVLGDGSIVPSLHAIDPLEIERLRVLYNQEITPRAFSEALFSGSEISGGAQYLFIERMEKGFDTQHISQKGLFKLTHRTATLFHDRLKDLLGEEKVPNFDLFAPVDALAGPRNGQVSRGLRTTFGNLLP